MTNYKKVLHENEKMADTKIFVSAKNNERNHHCDV